MVIGTSRIPFTLEEEACISAHLSSLAAKEHSIQPSMNYYQRKVAKFQPQIIVPNNSPTNSTKNSKFYNTFSVHTVSPINNSNTNKSNNNNNIDNNKDGENDFLSDVHVRLNSPRTPWNSPIPRSYYASEKDQNSFSSSMHSPLQNQNQNEGKNDNKNENQSQNHSIIKIGGQTGLTQILIPPRILNFYQNNIHFNNITKQTSSTVDIKLDNNSTDDNLTVFHFSCEAVRHCKYFLFKFINRFYLHYRKHFF